MQPDSRVSETQSPAALVGGVGGYQGSAVSETVAGSLDMAIPADRRFFAEAIRQGWQLDPGLKALGFQCVRKVLEAEQAKDKPNSRVLRHCMMIIGNEQKQALDDLHHLERIEGIKTAARIRAEHGRPPLQVGVAVQVNTGQAPAAPALESVASEGVGIDYDAFRRQFVADVVNLP